MRNDKESKPIKSIGRIRQDFNRFIAVWLDLLRRVVIPVVAFDFIFFLTLNSLIADWTWNPVWDVFFARVRGPIFYEVHASSILSVCFVGLYQIFRPVAARPFKFGNLYDKVFTANLYKWVLAAFGMASIHEFSILIFDFVQSGTWSGISNSYAIWLMSFLVLGGWLCENYQKRIWFYTLLFLAVYLVLNYYFIHVNSTIEGFQGTEYFLDFKSNAAEVLGWVIPSLFFLLPRKWLEKRVLL